MPDLVDASDIGALSGPPGTSLSNRLTTAFFATAFLLALATSAILYWATIKTLQFADDQVVDKRAGTVIDILQAKELNDGLLAHEVNEDNQGPRQIFMRVVSKNPLLQLETEHMKGLLAPELFPVPGAANLVPIRATITSQRGLSYRAASFRVPVISQPGDGDAILQVATDTSLDNESLSLFRRILFFVISAALPLSALASWYVVDRGLKPLDRIAAASQKIDGGKLDQRIALTDLPAELHEFGVHFNSMLGRLEATWSDLRHYADTIAHELRTPLNRMRLDCEIALDKAQSLDEFRGVMGSAVQECERLTQLLHGLLFLARVESKQASIDRSPVSLAEQIALVSDFFEADAAEKGVALTGACAPGLSVDGDARLIQQILTNLVSNAIAHTPRGGRISIGASRKGNEAVIDIEDTGDGIAPEDQPRIFDRFYRAGRAAQGKRGAKNTSGGIVNSEHLGLGLSITKGIVDLHDGAISLASEPGKGTRVQVRLPAAV